VRITNGTGRQPRRSGVGSGGSINITSTCTSSQPHRRGVGGSGPVCITRRSTGREPRRSSIGGGEDITSTTANQTHCSKPNKMQAIFRRS
jgi:hypothetical protein